MLPEIMRIASDSNGYDFKQADLYLMQKLAKGL
jgi:hypothetical protein